MLFNFNVDYNVIFFIISDIDVQQITDVLEQHHLLEIRQPHQTDYPFFAQWTVPQEQRVNDLLEELNPDDDEQQEQQDLPPGPHTDDDDDDQQQDDPPPPTAVPRRRLRGIAALLDQNENI